MTLSFRKTRAYSIDNPPNPAVDPAPSGRWTLRDKAAQRQSAPRLALNNHNNQNNSMNMKAFIEDIQFCFNELIENDGSLFECEIFDQNSEEERKLHEVCINHKLANYFDKYIIPKLQEETFYVDIEFNREGKNEKKVEGNNGSYGVRPDIIIHNRRSGFNKNNFLIVECKKDGATKKDLKDDVTKIIDMMKDEKYKYRFGLQVIYCKGRVEGNLFYREENEIINEKILS